MLLSIKWENDKVYILDQRKLPQEIEFIECKDHEEVAKAIENLSIRGAPAIGIASAMAVA